MGRVGLGSVCRRERTSSMSKRQLSQAHHFQRLRDRTHSPGQLASTSRRLVGRSLAGGVVCHILAALLHSTDPLQVEAD